MCIIMKATHDKYPLAKAILSDNVGEIERI